MGRSYACAYAFQPCYNGTTKELMPVCESACQRADNYCEVSLLCQKGNANGLYIDSDDVMCLNNDAARLGGWAASLAVAVAVTLAAALSGLL